MKSSTPTIDPKTGLKILRGKLTSDGSQIKVYCPHCATHHLHGWPSGSTDLAHTEHRQAHCIDTLHSKATDSLFWDRGYLIAVEGQPRNADPLTAEQYQASAAGALLVIKEIRQAITAVEDEAPEETAPAWLLNFIDVREVQIRAAARRHQQPTV